MRNQIKRIEKIREEKINADFILCKKDELFYSPMSPDHNKNLYVSKNIFFDENGNKESETKWYQQSYSQILDLLMVHFKMSKNEAEKILN